MANERRSRRKKCAMKNKRNKKADRFPFSCNAYKFIVNLFVAMFDYMGTGRELMLVSVCVFVHFSFN